MPDLLKLADRVEALEGPSREVDAEIWCALYAPEGSYVKQSPFNGAWCVYQEVRGKERLVESSAMRGGRPEKAAFTASLDAAMSLVPEGSGDWNLSLDSLHKFEAAVWACSSRYIATGNKGICHQGYHKTSPAIALVAAALRAIAQEKGE